MMRTIIFLVIVLVSGALAGTLHGIANLALVEPYLDEAIGIENQNLFASGEEEDTPQFWVEYDAYRDWQKGGQVLAGSILGTSIGALFGIVYALSRNALPQGNDLKKAFVLAAIMWFSIYIIPFLKYPANPPTVGDGETVVLRAILYLSFIAISGFGVVGFYQMYKRMRKIKKVAAVAGYAAFIAAVFVLMPQTLMRLQLRWTWLTDSAQCQSLQSVCSGCLLPLSWGYYGTNSILTLKPNWKNTGNFHHLV